MKAPIKLEGIGTEKIVGVFNGINITQTQDFIKVHCSSYLNRLCNRHSHWMNKFPPKNEPLPLNADKTFIKKLETAVGEAEEFEVLEKEFDFKYRSATGELIFAMVTARCDISFACVKLCQYNNCPARTHFEAVRDILLCMRGTKEDGIHFWRKTKNKSLPKAPYPSTRSATYVPDIPNIALHPTRPYVYADSDWASDYATRKSVSGIALMFAEAIILYKTQFQKATALSSTEAEFYALCDAEK